jgi:hypothetical protein
LGGGSEGGFEGGLEGGGREGDARQAVAFLAKKMCPGALASVD